MKFSPDISTTLLYSPFPVSRIRSKTSQYKIAFIIHSMTDCGRYLEDIVPLIDYRPLASRPARRNKDTMIEEQIFADELQERGIDGESIHAIQKISLSDRIDFDVSCSSCHEEMYAYSYRCAAYSGTCQIHNSNRRKAWCHSDLPTRHPRHPPMHRKVAENWQSESAPPSRKLIK